MKNKTSTSHLLPNEIETLRSRLNEAEDTLRAIGQGEVDALVVGTGRKRRAFTLRGAEHPYRVMVEHMQEGALTIAPTGTILYSNNQFARMLHMPLEKIFGASVFDFIAEPDKKFFRKLMENGRKQGSYGEIDLKSNNDTILPVYLSLTNLQEHDVPVMSIVVTDISRFRLASIVESSSDALYSTSLTNEIISWNSGTEKLYGYHLDEVLGKNLSIIIPEDRLHEIKKITQSVKHKKSIDKYETIRCRKDGSRVNISETYSPIIDASGKVTGISVVARDITERKQTENNLNFLLQVSRILESSLDYKKTLTTAANLAIPRLADWCTIIILEEDKIQRLTTTHKDINKVKAMMKISDYFLSVPGIEHGAMHAIRTGESELVSNITEDKLQRSIKDSNVIETIREYGLRSYMTAPIKTQTNIYGAITFVSAESGRNYREEDLLVLEEFAGRSALAIERSRSIKELQNAVVLRDDFISAASHELKTPITSLKAYTQSLLRAHKNMDESQISTFLGKMDNEVNRLTSLVGDLLNAVRIQQGRLEYNEEEFDLNSLIYETIENIQFSFNKHKILVEGNVNRKVWGDKERIRQVIVNFLTNAAKYSPDADKIIVTLKSGKNRAEVGIQDFGIGIEREYLSKVFDKFFRVDSEEGKTFPGLGMGLHISKEIISRHGGTISVKSEKNKGSLFSFTLLYKQK